MLDSTVVHDERLLRIALAVIAQPGHTDARDCADHRGMATTINILANRTQHLAKVARRATWAHLWTTPEKLLSAAADMTEHAVIPGDPWWPEVQFDELEKLGVAQPWCLWVKTKPGVDPARAWGKAVAMVGTGNHTGHGHETVIRLTRELRFERYLIATTHNPAARGGLAETAFTTASLHDQGITLVIGTAAIDTPIAVTGAACQPSIYLTTTPDTVKDPGHEVVDYHAQIQAALTQATVVIETGTEPHVLAGIEAARDLNRHLAAVPGPALSPASRYCHHLIRQGHARLITSAIDLTDDLTGR